MFGVRHIPRTVVALSIVSLLTDLSSEMIYPLLPLFLTSVLGAGAVALGVVEGVAETTAALLKVVSGIWTDRNRRRKPFVIAGYGLAGLVRPLIGLATAWPLVLLLRFLDRVGKGIRTSPRDALIADVTDPAQRGMAYGFHRMMDHAGAVAGPLCAAALLSLGGFSLRAVFLSAAIPAVAVMVVILAGVREPEVHRQASPSTPSEHGNWRDLGRHYRWFLATLVLFTLGNSTDAFILLRLHDVGLNADLIAVVWALHHVVKMGASFLGGALSDRWGRRPLIVSAWLLYAAIYVAFAVADSLVALVVVFLVYGLYFGLAEPSEKAWVADLVPARVRGTAMGFYHGAVGVAALPASLLFGVLWYWSGSGLAFGTGAALALAAATLLMLMPKTGRSPTCH